MLLLAVVATAHEIPRDATVHAFVRPRAQQLQLIVRAPLGVIRDIAFPEDARGYLKVEELAPLLPDLVTVQIADLIEIYERDRRLPRPRVAATQISLESDRSLASFDEAVAHITGPKLPNSGECRLESGLSRRAI